MANRLQAGTHAYPNHGVCRVFSVHCYLTVFIQLWPSTRVNSKVSISMLMAFEGSTPFYRSNIHTHLLFVKRAHEHTCNSSTQEVEAGRLGGQGQLGLQREVEGNLGYMGQCIKSSKWG